MTVTDYGNFKDFSKGVLAGYKSYPISMYHLCKGIVTLNKKEVNDCVQIGLAKYKRNNESYNFGQIAGFQSVNTLVLLNSLIFLWKPPF